MVKPAFFIPAAELRNITITRCTPIGHIVDLGASATTLKVWLAVTYDSTVLHKIDLEFFTVAMLEGLGGNRTLKL